MAHAASRIVLYFKFILFLPLFEVRPATVCRGIPDLVGPFIKPDSKSSSCLSIAKYFQQCVIEKQGILQML
ncbi:MULTISPECIES: hypothetical protein [Novosphingobium]|uniref:hypothetical protein n=1 Tax=Novosphingobium TaxID=165696 RepID=UPI0022F2603A|nr:hypothetical protein [Novosphingobium resinovorum]